MSNQLTQIVKFTLTVSKEVRYHWYKEPIEVWLLLVEITAPNHKGCMATDGVL